MVESYNSTVMLFLTKTDTETFDLSVDSSLLPTHLAVCLRSVDAEAVEVLGNRVIFKRGAFLSVSNWNILVPFDSGEFTVDASAQEIRYSLWYRQLVVFTAISLCCMAAFLPLASHPKSQFGPLLALPFLGFIMIFGNLAIGLERFRGFVRRAIGSAPRRT